MDPGEVVAARFAVESIAGEGGMGTVYRARDTQSGAVVALKVLRGGARPDLPRFRREAELLRGFDHPHVVRYVAHGETDDGTPYLAMEWLEGTDLGQRLEMDALTIRESVDLCRNVARALGVAHARGIVHRDVKPANLFLVGGEVASVKLLDFGIARARARGTMQTGTGMVLGSIGYMAPEQARGDRDLGAQADVFSLGCVLFECLTGRPAFAGETAMAILAKILVETPPAVSALRADCPADLDALVAAMLTKRPDARPLDGAAIDRALGELSFVEGETQARSRSVGPAITESEARYVNVVLASLGAIDVAEADTIAAGEWHADIARIREAIARLGARLDALADGTLVVTLAGGEVAVDQALRACRCATEIRAALPHARVAIATGRAVVSGAMPLGDALDRAARLLADRSDPPPDASIAIDDVTAALVDGRIDVLSSRGGRWLGRERDRWLAQHLLLGKPVSFVGRDRELAMLDAALAHALDEPAASGVLVTAPPGAGKSRLLHEFMARVRARDGAARIWKASGDPLRAGAPFAMLGQVVRAASGVVEGDPITRRAERLRGFLGQLLAGAELSRAAAFLGEIASARAPGDTSEDLDRARKDAIGMAASIRAAWLDVVRAATASDPLVLLLEDLHWSDGPTVACVLEAERELSERPLFVLAMARPEVGDRFPALREGAAMQEIRLAALGKRAAEKLVRQALGDEVAVHVVARIVDGAAGNAFTLEELIRAEAEGHGGETPETVLAMLQARLESFDTASRRLLRAASVFGEVFWTGGVAELTGKRSDTGPLDGALAHLVAREVIAPAARSRFLDMREYTFRHALLRDAAYAMLPDADRRRAHRLAASWLENVGENEAKVLAEHLEAGAEDDASFLAAARGWLRAGQLSAQRFAHADAVLLLRRGVACADRMSIGEDRDRATWELLVAIASPLASTDGLQATSVREALGRALDLGERLGESSRCLPILIGLYANRLIRSEHDGAQALAERCRAMTRESPSSEARMHGLRPIWNVTFYRADFAAALETTAEAIAIHESAEGSTAGVSFASDTIANALAFRAATLWYAGRADAARETMRHAVERSLAVGQAYTRCLVAQNEAVLSAQLGDADGVERAAEVLRSLGEKHHFDMYERVADSILGIALSVRGDHERAIASLRRGLERTGEVDMRLGSGWVHTSSARSLRGLGRHDEALNEADLAIAIADHTGERIWVVEGLIERGRALEAMGRRADAIAAFGQGALTARSQRAPYLELRAQCASSVLVSQQDLVGARDPLEAALGRISEGFDTQDVTDARALLDRLK